MLSAAPIAIFPLWHFAGCKRSCAALTAVLHSNTPSFTFNVSSLPSATYLSSPVVRGFLLASGTRDVVALRSLLYGRSYTRDARNAGRQDRTSSSGVFGDQSRRYYHYTPSPLACYPAHLPAAGPRGAYTPDVLCIRTCSAARPCGCLAISAAASLISFSGVLVRRRFRCRAAYCW